MNLVKIIAGAGLVMMVAGIGYVLVAGDVVAEGTWLLTHPLGITSMLDLMLGLTFFALWIGYRERSWVRTAGWVVLLCLLGNTASALYVLLALWGSGGDWRKFWMGAQG